MTDGYHEQEKECDAAAGISTASQAGEAENQRVEEGKPSWVRRHPKTSVLFLLLVLLVGPYLLSRLTSSSRLVVLRDEDDFPTCFCENDTFTLAVMNIAHGRGLAESNWDENGSAKRQRVHRIGELLVELDADIVVLNEVDFNTTWSGHVNQATSLAKYAKYPMWIEQRNLDFRFLYGSFSFGNALLSRFPIANFKYIEYPAARDWEPWVCGKKGGASVTIQVQPKKFIQIFPVHTEHRDERVRYESVEEIIRSTSQAPTILAGDFNSTPTGFPGHHATRNNKNSLDLMFGQEDFETRPQSSPQPEDFTFPSNAPEKVIDWVFVSKHFEIIDYQVVDSELSDHRPVLVTLKLKPPAGQSTN